MASRKVEQALRAVDAGEAYHWPTIATILAAEVRRLARPRPGRITVYRDREREWRWRFVRSGRKMADSGQGYVHRADAIHGAREVCGYDVEIYAQRWRNGRMVEFERLPALTPTPVRSELADA